MALGLAAVALAAAACGDGRKYGGAEPTLSPGAVGTLRASPTKTPSRRASDTPTLEEPAGVIEVIVTDASGRRRSGVPVHITPEAGGRARTVRTDAGIARVRLAPGYYTVEVRPGCAGEMKIDRGAGGRAGVADRSTSPVPLTIDVERRWQAVPQDWLPEAPWERGEVVRFDFAMIDRCPGGALGRDLPIDHLRFDPSSHLEVLDVPARTRDDGTATIRFRCVRAGNASLFAVDTEDPADRSNLLAGSVPFFPAAEWCE